MRKLFAGIQRVGGRPPFLGRGCQPLACARGSLLFKLLGSSWVPHAYAPPPCCQVRLSQDGGTIAAMLSAEGEAVELATPVAVTDSVEAWLEGLTQARGQATVGQRAVAALSTAALPLLLHCP
jgi:hypothetical protein